MKKIFVKSAKIIAGILLSILLLFVVLVILIQIPSVQNKIKDQAIQYLEGKIGTKVALQRIEIGFPKKIVVKGLYLESQQQDTLLYAENLAVDISLFKLLNNTVEVNSIALDQFVAHVKRDKNQRFNFDYIIDAFATEDEPEKESKPFAISLDRIELNKILVTFDDQYGGNDLYLKLNRFSTRVKRFDLEQFIFSVPKINLDGVDVRFKRTVVDPLERVVVQKTDSISEGKVLDLQLRDINLTNIKVEYDDAVSEIYSKLDLKNLELNVDKLDFANQNVVIDALRIDDTKAVVRLLKNKKQQQAVVVTDDANETAEVSNPWNLTLGQLKLQGLAVQFDDENAPKQQLGMDYKHLDFPVLNLELDDFHFAPNNISGAIKSALIQEKSGLDIQELRTYFMYGAQTAFLKDLYLKTPQTLLQREVVLMYESPEKLSSHLEDLVVDASLVDSKIGFKDILLFVPDLIKQPLFKNDPNGILTVDAQVKGPLKDLEITKFFVKGLGSTFAQVSGHIKGLPNMDKAVFDLDIKDFQTTAKDILNIVPKGTVPANIKLPALLSLRGTFKGGLSNFNTNLKLNSSYGAVSLIAQLDQRIKNKEKYRIDAVVNKFDVGRLIKNDSLGKISLTAVASGQSFNPKTANATLSGHLLEAQFNGYNYKDLLISGQVKSGAYQLQTEMNDPNIQFAVKANGQLDEKNMSLVMDGDFVKIDLWKLNLTDQPLAVKALVSANFSDLNPDYLNGDLYVDDFALANGKDVYTLNKMSLKAISDESSNSIVFNSQLMDASITGKYQLTKLPEALKKTFSTYFDLDQSEKKAVSASKNVGKKKAVIEEDQDQEVNLKLTVKNDPILAKFLPDLKSFGNIQADGKYLSAQNYIAFTANVPDIEYGKNKVSNISFELLPKNETLKYNFAVDQVQSESFVINQVILDGDMHNNILNYDLEIKDSENEVQYGLEGSLETLADYMQVKLVPNALKLNYQNWTVKPENQIRFTKAGINAQDFVLSKEGSKIALQSTATTFDSPLQINFIDFDIQTITEMFKKDVTFAKGFINGQAELRNIMTDLVFVSDIKVTDLEVMQAKVGNLSIEVSNEMENQYDAQIALSGQGNQMTMKGFYKALDKTFDLQLNVEKLQMETIEGFSMGNISNAEGFLSGNLDIKGSADKPSILGKFLFNKVGIHVIPLNADYKDINETIDFTPTGIVLHRFQIKDADDNKLTIDGRVNTKNYADFKFDLSVVTNNFKAINSTEKDNDFFYGDLYLDANLKITGDLNKPEVNGKIAIDKNTKFTVVMPQQDPSIADREGIVEFIDQRDQKLLETVQIENKVNESNLKGMEVFVDIQIDKEAELILVIDKVNGDMLRLKGEADLTGGIDPSGKTTLTGKYEFSEGSYEMSFNFIKRKFDIQKGSSIVWTGEPTMATLDLTAIYTVKTAPIDLLEAQLSGLTPMIKNTYKQKIPFQTLLMMKGELLKPEISFNITLPENNNSVSSEVLANTKAKLEQLRLQPSEMNKQVFALLLLSRFVGENPFESEAGGMSAESMARQSVSKILSDQLNNLAGDLIAGVEMDFDLQSTEDYSSGEKENRTDLNVGLSKRMLDDRLKVTIGSSFGLEGSERQNEQSTNIAGDLSAEYMLSKDGRYMLRAYRKNQYQVALQGQVIETGVGFIITMNYEHFRELFERSKERKTLRRQSKKETNE